MPSFSSTSTAAIAAVIFAMRLSPVDVERRASSARGAPGGTAAGG
jgi:hypothetical protein